MKTDELCDFEEGFCGWEIYAWRKIFYDSDEAVDRSVETPVNTAGVSNQAGEDIVELKLRNHSVFRSESLLNITCLIFVNQILFKSSS